MCQKEYRLSKNDFKVGGNYEKAYNGRTEKK